MEMVLGRSHASETIRVRLQALSKFLTLLYWKLQSQGI